MSRQILVVTDNQDLITLCRKANPDFTITCTTTVADGLAALTLSLQYSVVLVDSTLPEINVAVFFEQASKNSSAVPLLTAEEFELAPALDIVNQLKIFRLLPLPCSLEQLETVFYDAACQYKLIHRERNLRKKLQQLSVIDALTGCCTRDALQERLPPELQRSIRYAHYLSIILCDIDQLNKTNETHGHRVGDRILTGVAQAALEFSRRDVDWITRWGDDEFLIVLPETPIRGAGIVAERLRQTVAKLAIDSKNDSAQTTISVGVTGYAPEAPDWNNTVDHMLLVAGNCLGQAKAGGGNRVLVCP